MEDTKNIPHCGEQKISKAEMNDILEEYDNRKKVKYLMNIELFVAFVALCAIVGINWLYFVIALVACLLLSFQIFRIVYCIGITLVWAILGFFLFPWLAIVFGIVSLICHWPAMKADFDF